MYPPVDTKDPAAVEAAVQSAFLSLFPKGDRLFVPRIFGWLIECFTGNYGQYQAVDALYHDFEHTLQGTLCMARLLRGRAVAGADPALPQRVFELGLLAILLHDTGYLKTRDDTEGTGAKYTATHVDRSASFAQQLLSEKGFCTPDIQAVRNMIHCTGVNISLEAIPFQSPSERVAGCALGTADLLGQMAADDYVDKLPTLYSEFVEAAHYSRDNRLFISTFTSADDLMRKTPTFWEKFVLVRLDGAFGGLYRYLNDPYPSGPNDYLEKVEANIGRIKRRLQLANGSVSDQTN